MLDGVGEMFDSIDLIWSEKIEILRMLIIEWYTLILKR